MLKTNLDIVSVIPARSGSKGVPGKNLRLLGGVPLFVWSIMCSRQSTKINQTIVSTDSQEYAEVARKWGADVPFLRPDNISQDNSTDLDFVLHLLSFFKSRASSLIGFNNDEISDERIEGYRHYTQNFNVISNPSDIVKVATDIVIGQLGVYQ